MELDTTLTPKQKAQLQEVADLLLQLYQTLARMRYIDAEWIQPGPHDISAHLPLYASLGLDPRIIYLYGILPYINPVFAGGVYVFQSCGVADFRCEEHVREAREHLAEDDDPTTAMQPWVTALSRMGEHAMIVAYDAQRHVLFFVEINWAQNHNCDRNLKEGRVFEEWVEEGGTRISKWFEEPLDGRKDVPLVEVVDIEEWRRQHGWYDREEAGDSDDQRGCERGEEEEEEEQEEEEEELEPENEWDYMDARPAGNVLRDMIRWYRELVEVPGCCCYQNDGWEGREDFLRALYRKHGWPGENFDGGAFDVDRVRAKVQGSIKHYDPEYFLSKLESLERQVEKHAKDDRSAAPQRQQKLTAAESLREEWMARWEIWNAEQRTNASKNRLKRAKEMADLERGRQKIEDLPLWEWNYIQNYDLRQQRKRVASLEQELEAAEISSKPQIEERIRHAKKQMAIHQEACAATEADAERLCSGRSLSSLKPCEGPAPLGCTAEIESFTRELGDLEQEVVHRKDWIAQLPESADEARKLAQDVLEEREKDIEHLKSRRETEVTRRAAYMAGIAEDISKKA